MEDDIFRSNNYMFLSGYTADAIANHRVLYNRHGRTMFLAMASPFTRKICLAFAVAVFK